ncbi:MAG: M10 family metallopeptidase C-terminal domain-containing protein, partial [Planctomycetota bacterium]
MSTSETQAGGEPDSSGACTCIFCAAQQAWSATVVGDGGYQLPAEASWAFQTSSGSQDINGLLSASKWTGSITYSFPASASFYEDSYGSNEPGFGFSQLNSTQQAAATAAVQMYNTISNANITQITETASVHADLRFANSTLPSTAWAYYPGNYPEAGDSWFGSNFTNPIKGTYAYAGFMHELGHALGLKHGQETNVYGPLPSAHDSMEFSVMTYRSYVGAALNGYTNQGSSYAQTLMMDDIAAIQFMYGANFNTNNGNTTYTWSASTGEMFLNGVGQGAPSGNRIFLTIWDGGGADTYDMSNYSSGVSIDLTPGGWSTTTFAQLADLNQFAAGYEARGNVFNALQYNGDARSLIENAIGGVGADVVLGNAAVNALYGNGGNDTLSGLDAADTLTGGTGADLLIGGNGADVFVFDDGDTGASVGQRDWITDFSVGTDRLDLILLDASSLTGVDDLFMWLGTAAFMGGAGSLREYYDASRGMTVIEGDTNGDNTADFAIDLSGNLALTQTDFAAGSLVLDQTLNGSSGDDTLTAAGGVPATIYGLGGNDTLTGGASNDVIDGGSGNDIINGLAGMDSLIGGSGNDTFYVDAMGDAVVESAGGGVDTVISTAMSYTLGSEIEIGQSGTSSGILLTGNSLANTLTGN